LSTDFHPQIDKQTEVINQYLDQKLRPFVNYYQDNQLELLPIMDYAQLTLPHDNIGMLPFELLNAYPPPDIFRLANTDSSYTTRTTKPRGGPRGNQDASRNLGDGPYDYETSIRQEET
jgi:hypothetical protein